MAVATQAEYLLGDLQVRYLARTDQPRNWGLQLVPAARAEQRVEPREYLDSPAVLSLPAPWNRLAAGEVEPLVHVHVSGATLPGGYANGRTLRHSESTRTLTVCHHAAEKIGDRRHLRTELVAECGLVCRHELTESGAGGVEIRTAVENPTARPITIDLLSAFSLGGISPFVADDAPGRIRVHRFRSAWSAEGRHEVRSVEALNLERSWTGHGLRLERFGQTGSLPVNGWFPVVALEDTVAGVVWLAQLAVPGTWHLEVSRRADTLSLAGASADRLSGEWQRTLAPGESHLAPLAFLTAVVGTIDEATDRLIAWLRLRAPAEGAETAESGVDADPRQRALPVVFNEWCSSWGHPTHDSLVRLADRLAGSGVRYLVIDDGWAERPSDGFQQNGDWRVNRGAFPQGLRATADAIRARGLTPGIWFEFETVNAGSQAWEETAHLLQRDGVPLQVGNRRFWNFADPWVHAFLGERVIGRLLEGGFGYLKVDCNDSIGPGVDGPASPGENLRRHLDGVQRFFARVRAELPELVIENCASGGHRLEPSFMALSAMSSFSDAHETLDIPIIAANLNRLVWAGQKQIWAVLRKEDARPRLTYSLAATFLGRMCLSGDLEQLTEESWAWVRSAVALYHDVAVLIRDGVMRCQREIEDGYQHPRGFQIVTMAAPADPRRLVVWHRFAGGPSQMTSMLPAGKAWSVERSWGDPPTTPQIHGTELAWSAPDEWTAGVLVLRSER